MKRLVVITFALLAGCAKHTDFLYVHPAPHTIVTTQKVREVIGSNQLDILWLIGGMTEQEQNFHDGMKNFMQDFMKKNFIDWKMGVIGNAESAPPYLGMTSIFDMKDSDPMGNLLAAVRTAVFGMDGEAIFDPLYSNLKKYPGFVRPGSTLAIIMTNDNHDESTHQKTASQMMSFLASLKGGDISKVIVYGIFGSTDLGCNPSTIDEDWQFHGTQMEALITQTGGETLSLCNASFGYSLAKIGDNLFQRLKHPRIALTRRPIISTLQVKFHGANLLGGDPAKGGVWYYDFEDNSVVFYNLDFAQQDTESVTVVYDEDFGD
jgi:hypothetical protein